MSTVESVDGRGQNKTRIDIAAAAGFAEVVRTSGAWCTGDPLTATMKSVSKLLIDDRPLVILPKLACAIGLLPAVVLQQINFYLSNDRSGVVLQDGQRWIFNTYEQWAAIFPFESERTIRRAIVALEELGLIFSCQPEGGISRRKYYRIADDVEEKLVDRLDNHVAKLSTSSSGKFGQMDRPNRPLPITETSSETSQRGDPTGSASPFFLPPVAAKIARMIQSGEYADPVGEARNIQGPVLHSMTLRHLERAMAKNPFAKKPDLPSTATDDESLFPR